MKTVFASLALVFALTTINSAQAASPIFSFNSYDMFSGKTEAHILDDGHVYVKRARPSGEVIFDDVVARFSESDTKGIIEELAAVQPGMRVRELSRQEKKDAEGCVSEGAYSYSVSGERFESGSLTVTESHRCLMVGLRTNTKAERAADRAVRAAVKTLRGVLNDNADRIYPSR